MLDKSLSPAARLDRVLRRVTWFLDFIQCPEVQITRKQHFRNWISFRLLGPLERATWTETDCAFQTLRFLVI
jgi:hypothetical protein